MRKLRNSLFILTVCAAFSCSMSAKPDKANEDTAKATTETTTTAEGEVVNITKAEFLTKIFNYEKSPNKWVYEGNKPCIIDFYADWCGPCKAVAPILKELASEYKGKIIIYKINVDKEKELAGAFGIRSIPTMLFVPQTGTPMMSQGALPKEELVKQIDNFLLKK